MVNIKQAAPVRISVASVGPQGATGTAGSGGTGGGTTVVTAATSYQWARNWLYHLSNRFYAPARITVTGSSTVEGAVSTTTYRRATSRMEDILQAAYNPAGVVGGYHAKFLDTGWNVGGGTTNTIAYGGLGRRSYSVPTAGVLNRTDSNTTGYTVMYGQGPSAGTFDIFVDDVKVTSITPSTTGSARNDGVWSSAKLTRGSHKISFTSTSGNAVIDGVYVHDGDLDLGVQVYNDGMGGAAVSDFVSTGSSKLGTLQPGLIIFLPGATEIAGNMPAATFKANVKSLIDQRKAASPNPPSFLLMGTFKRTDTTNDWNAYMAALKELADADPDNVGYVYVGNYFPTVNSGSGDPYNIINDNDVHLTDRGHALLGDLMAGAILEITQTRPTSGNAVSGGNTATVTTTVPDAPTNVTATAGDAQAVVNWSSPSNSGGSAISTYTITSSPGNIVVNTTALNATVTGLTNGTAYTFTVKANNSVGASVASSPSNSVTPAAPAANPAPAPSGDSPTSISGIQAFYDPATIALADNAPVASWPDSGPNAYTATMATAANQPTYSTAGINGKPAVKFSTAQRLVSNLPSSTTPFTIIFTGKPTGTGSRTVIGSNGAGGRHIRFAGANAGTQAVILILQQTAVLGQQTNSTTAEVEVVSLVWTGTELFIKTNGVSQPVSVANTTAFTAGTKTSIGSKDDQFGDQYTGWIGDIVQVAGRMSDADILKEERRQGAKYGVTIP